MSAKQWPHEFRSQPQRQAADQMLDEMQTGPVDTQTLIGIGQSWGLYEGQATGVISTLHKTGKIESAGQGHWRIAKADQ